MNAKVFAERLHRELNEIDIPIRQEERIEAFAKLMDIPRFKAESLLSGATVPDAALLTRIAEELEVNEAWLLGESDSKEK